MADVQHNDEHGVSLALGQCGGKVAIVHVRLCNYQDLIQQEDADAADMVEEHFYRVVEAVVRPEDHLLAIDAMNVLLVLDNLVDENHAELAGLKLARVFEEFAANVQAPALPMKAVSGLVYVGRQPSARIEVEQLLNMAIETVERAVLDEQDFLVVRAGTDADSESEWLTNHRLSEALDNHDVTLDYQPKVNLDSGELVGAEALVRWRDQGVIVAPGEFLPVLTNELLWDLTVYCFRRVLREIPDYGIEVPVGVNIDPSVLVRSEFVSFAVNESALWGVDPSQIVLEIIESSELFDVEMSLRHLRELKSHGFKISIDDFGTGHSNMARVSSVVVDEIKIDRSFSGNLNEENCRHITLSIIDLAHKLGATAVAEGIEDAATMEQLKAWGCVVGQGFYLGAPMPIDEFANLS